MARLTKRKPRRIRTEQSAEGEVVRSKIVDALNSDRYKARTISGIAKVAHVHSGVVIRTIKNDPDLRQMVKVYPRRSAKGELLLTTKDRFYKEASFADKFVDVFASKRWGLDDA